MSAAMIVPAYLLDFACLTGRCPDNCCLASWRIQLLGDQFARLRAAMAEAPADRAILERFFQPVPGGGGEILETAPSPGETFCPFLRADGLCRIHSRYGPEVLPHACLTFPREFREGVGLTFVSGSLACPEIGRRSLLGPPRLQLFRLPPAPSAGAPAPEPVPWNWETEPAPEAKRAGRIFEGLQDLLLAPENTPGFGIFLAGCLASRLRPADLAVRLKLNPDLLLTAALAEFGDPDTIGRLRESYRSATVAGQSALGEAWKLLVAVAGQPQAPYAQTVRRCLETYAGSPVHRGGSPSPETTPDGPGLPPPESLPPAAGEIFRRRRAALQETFPGRLDGYWRRYARHFLAGELPLAPEEVLGAIQTLSLHLAVLAVLLLGHPAANGLVETTGHRAGPAGPGPLPADSLDQAIVETATCFARAITHNTPFSSGLKQLHDRPTAFALPELLPKLMLLG